MTMIHNSKILVVCGGTSSERDVSLRTGKAVFEALKNKGYVNTQLFILCDDNVQELLNLKPDIVFLGLHGKGGEDGCIQGMLELAHIPYTGSGVACSAICMDKILTKRMLNNALIPTSPFYVCNKREFDNEKHIISKLLQYIGLPMVLKAPCQGSSIGVVIIKTNDQLETGIEEVFKYGDELLAERFLDGIELTVPMLGNNHPELLPIIEITSEREFYDYKSKYTTGLCHHIIPARISNEVEQKVKRIALDTYKVLNCRGMARIDIIADKKLGPMVVEVNTLPGMTDMSLFPDSAKYAGLSYNDLIEKILLLGIE